MAKRNGLQTYFKRVDIFGTDVAFRESGGESFGSIFGAVNSLIIVLIVSLYGINKFTIMNHYEDTLFNEYTVKQGLTTDLLGQDELQFQIAFQMLDLNLDTEES